MATSIKAVNKYNKKTYKSFSARLKPELYDNVIAYCKDNNLSYPEFIAYALEVLNTPKK